MSKVILHNCIKTRTGLTKENYIWSETHFLEKRKTSYVGSYRERNVSLSVARPSKNRLYAMPSLSIRPMASNPFEIIDVGRSPDRLWIRTQIARYEEPGTRMSNPP